MIHFGKVPSGDLEIRVSPDDVGEVLDMIQSAGLLQRRTFDKLKRYITTEYESELEEYRKKMLI